MFRISRSLVVLAIMAVVGLPPGSAQAGGHDHSSHAAGTGHAKLNGGSKWASDDNLHQGMSRIRAALSAERAAISSGKMPADRYRALAQTVNDQVAFMIHNCRLDKEADEALHLILAELMAGAEAISSAGDEQSGRPGLETIGHALEGYSASFEHPGWKGAE